MSGKPTLKRQIGLVGGISYVAGTIIGSGIFISPSAVLIGCGHSVGLSLCLWSLCGILALLGAISYAELGCRITKSGGDYTYIKEAFGNVPAFLCVWSNLVLRPMSAAIGCMASSEYIIATLTCPESVPPAAKTLLTIVILAFITAINCYSVRIGSYYQTISTVCKLVVLVVIIVAGFVHLTEGHTEHFTEPFLTTELTVLGLTKAFYSALFAYNGWDVLGCGAEEIQKSGRTLPFSILIGVLIPVVVYVSTNIAYHAVLTNSEITSGIAVALVFSKKTLSELQWVVLPTIGLFAAVVVNSNIFWSSRFNFVAGRDNLFPRFLSMVSMKHRTPLISILILFILAMIIILIGDISSLLPTYTFFKVLGSICSVLSLRWIRLKYPGIDCAIKAPNICPILYVCILTLIGITFIIMDTSVLIIVAAFLASGIAVYYLSRSSTIKLGAIKSLNDGIVIISQRLLQCDFSTELELKE